MTPGTLQFVWTWIPIALNLSVLGVLAVSNRGRVLAPLIIIANLLASLAFDRAIAGDDGANFTLWSAIGFGCIDWTTGVLLLACNECALTLLFAFSVLGHVAFGLVDKPSYQSCINYGWLVFILSILPAFILIGKSNGGGRHIRRLRAVLPSGRRRLAHLKGLRPDDGALRG